MQVTAVVAAVAMVAGVAMVRVADRRDLRSVEGTGLGIAGVAKESAAGISAEGAAELDKHAVVSSINPTTARLAVYYGNELPWQAFAPYNLIVFDRDEHPLLSPLKRSERILLAYVSIGKAETFRSDYRDIEDQGLILDTRSRWKGDFFIDVRKQEWTVYMLNTLIPAIMAQGFDGIMLDTADSLIEVEKADPARYAGLSQAGVDLIKGIRERYPHLIIMLNRGFEILPEVEGDIDFVLAESIYTHWTGVGAPELVPDSVYQHYVTLLKNAEAKAPMLKVATIDYWPVEDKNTIRRIYATQRAQRFIPYVTTSDLQSLTPEPQ